jgi:multiple sugar transport system permease protein
VIEQVVAHRERVATSRARRRAGRLAGRLALHCALIAISATALVPLAWMVSTSLKPSGTELEWPIRWIPSPIVWSNYVRAHQSLSFGYYYRNTITITALATLGAVITSSMAGFAFARLRFFGRDALFLLVLATLMLPSIVTLIPTYIIWRSLGFLDTLVPLIVPSWLGGSALYVFLIRQFMLSLPR